jgi:phage/plasmid-like protein (TIGR03299 family)
MAWVGDRGLPWWVGTAEDTARLKAELEGLATGAEIREAAGLNWAVEKKPIYVGRKGPLVPDKFAVVRDDTEQPLGVVGKAYQLVQNEELDAWGDALVDSGEAKYETAGSLRGGKTVFLSMELNHLEINVGGDKVDEAIKTFLLLTNTHDGTKALEAAITCVRVVCVNTLNMALREAKSHFRLRHVGSMQGKVAAAREALGITFRYTEELKRLGDQLLLKKVVDEQVYEILSQAVWPVSPEWSENRLENSLAQGAYELYQTSENLDNIRGTAWGVLQAVAEFADHEATFKGRGASSAADVRANSILFGQAQWRKELALKALQAV